MTRCCCVFAAAWPRNTGNHEIAPLTTVLQQSSEGWTLTDGSGRAVVLGLDPARLASRHWPSVPPRAIDLERAIDAVEEAIEAGPLRNTPRGVLLLSGEVSAQMPLWHDIEAGALLSRDEVEQAFSRVVASPGASTPPGETVAALLMLRELMHHLGFSHLGLIP